MDNSQDCAVGKEEEEDDNMLRRIWKKFKGSPPEDDLGEPIRGQHLSNESAPVVGFQRTASTT